MFRLYGALIVLSLIWGLSFVFMKWLLPSAGIWGIVFLRCIAGAVVLIPFIWWHRKEFRGKLPWKALILVGILNCGLPWGLISLSETRINSTQASIFNATTPIWTGLIGFSLFSYRLSRRQWIGILIGFVGIVVLMNFQVGHIFGKGFVGTGTMLSACICYALSGQLTKRFLSKVSVIVITTFALSTGAIIGLIGMLLTEPFKPTVFTSTLPVLAVIGIGCLGSGIGQLLYFYINKTGGPVLASSVTYLIPASAMVWGYVLLGEAITTNIIIGLVIIFAGVYLSTKKSTKNKILNAYNQKSIEK